MTSTQRTKNTHRNKEIRDLLFVTRPRFAVLPPTPGDVSTGTMDDHNHEEDEVEPGERTPAERKNVSNQDAHSKPKEEEATHLNPVTAPQAKLNHMSGT